ncbi:hypothetical protein GK047_21190 [Paenibacillus sp. SYP-B3998]|uniref:AFP-like domain-containing protein n=1 Tax=Paenibacillus sp. SYP-B3998 TaxID=2678564 RepID=A0A6G4A4E2_9BACL|nr:N-acetylneuraminate synthase family protein [Paenibacillus sp. SYP-B3998]NEW08517.1 hypothetical protein [Paenibacillus sp. SYP-B3998]
MTRIHKWFDGAHRDSSEMYWIAEPAYTHQGDFQYLLALVDALIDSGADAVKFHLMLDLDEYIVSEHPLYPDLQKWLFTREQWREVFARCRRGGVEIVGLADELPALDFLIEEKVDAIGIHATCINDYFMLKRLSEIKQPLFIGIGGIQLSEIELALQLLAGSDQIILMYGIQHYPTPPQSIHLHKLLLYQTHFRLPVGYADHTASEEDRTRSLVYAAAFGLGVRIFEQHVTLDLATKREDDEAAIEVAGVAKLKEQLELVAVMTGNTEFDLKAEEREYFAKVRKCMLAAQDLPVGTVLTEQHIKFKRTKAQGDMEQKDFTELIGKTLLQEIHADEAFCWKHVRKQ